MSDGVGDGDAGQFGAFAEGPASDAGDTVGDDDFGQAAAVGKGIIANVSQAVGESDVRQESAAAETSSGRFSDIRFSPWLSS